MPSRRLFIGFPLSSPLTKRLSSLRRGWEAYPLFLVPDTNLHVTLLFLGFVPEEEIFSLCENLEKTTSLLPSAELRFERIDFFPTDSEPHSVALLGAPSESLLRMRNGIEKTLGYLNPPHKSFRPHVTLARLKRRLWKDLLPQPTLTQTISLVEAASSLSLFEVLVLHGKRRYEVVAEFPLAG